MPVLSMITIPALAASDLLVYALPSVGFMLLFYGVYQVVVESRVSSRKKTQQRLRGGRIHEEKVASSILRRAAKQGTLADHVLGRFAFVPRLQTLLDQADVDWSASQTILNLSGGAVLIAEIGRASCRERV